MNIRNTSFRHLQCLLFFLRMILDSVISHVFDFVAFANYIGNKDFVYVLFTVVIGFSSILGGILSLRFNNKKFVLYGRCVSAFVTYVTPFILLNTGLRSLYLLGIVQGVLSGFSVPCVYNMMRDWIPLDEMDYIGPLVLYGSNAGAILFHWFSVDFSLDFDERYPSTFNLVALLESSWCVAFYLFGADGPERKTPLDASEVHGIPWKSILSNVPFQAATVAIFADKYAQFVTTFYPHILKEVHDFTDESLSNLEPIYCATGLVSTIVFALTVKKLSSVKLLTKKVLRFTSNTLGQSGAALALIALSTSHSSAAFNTSLVLYFILTSWRLFGEYLNVFDHSESYVGLQSGISIGLASLGSLAARYLSKFFVENLDSDLDWRYTFLTAGVVLFFGNIVFISYGKVKFQPYDTKEAKGFTVLVH